MRGRSGGPVGARLVEALGGGVENLAKLWLGGSPQVGAQAIEQRGLNGGPQGDSLF